MKSKSETRRELYPGLATSLIVPEKNIFEAFRPIGILKGLDQENPSIREGMRITFELLKEMNETCRQNHVQFVVVVIPTKEMVFSEYLEHNSKIPLDDVIDNLLVNERSALQQTFKFLTDSNIAYVDPLPALKRSVSAGPLCQQRRRHASEQERLPRYRGSGLRCFEAGR